MTGHQFRDLIAGYIHHNFAAHGLIVDQFHYIVIAERRRLRIQPKLLFQLLAGKYAVETTRLFSSHAQEFLCFGVAAKRVIRAVRPVGRR